MKNKILFISTEIEHSNSSASYRNKIFLNSISKFHVVDVLDVNISSDIKFYRLSESINRKYVLFNHDNNNSVYDGKVRLLLEFKKYFSLFIKPFIPDKVWYLNLTKVINELELELELDSYDFIISSSDPKGIHKSVINFIKKQKAKKVNHIQIWGDPWYGDIARPTNIITKYLEKKLISSSHSVFYNSKSTVSMQKKFFPKLSDKIRYLPRGLESSVSELVSIQNKGIKLLYAGDYRSSYRDLSALCLACSQKRIPLTIYGNGDLPAEHKAEIKGVEFYDRVSQEYIENIKHGFSHMVVVLNNTGTQIPGKLFDVMSENIPILLIYNSREQLINIPNLKRFICVSNDVNSINKAIENENKKDAFIVDKSDNKLFFIDELVEDFFCD